MSGDKNLPGRQPNHSLNRSTDCLNLDLRFLYLEVFYRCRRPRDPPFHCYKLSIENPQNLKQEQMNSRHHFLHLRRYIPMLYSLKNLEQLLSILTVAYPSSIDPPDRTAKNFVFSYSLFLNHKKT